MRRYAMILTALTLFAAGPSAGQEPKPIRKLIHLEHGNAEEIGRLLQWIRFYPSRTLKAITVEGAPDDVAKAEEIIRAVDRPYDFREIYDGAVEIDAYFLSAGAAQSGAAVPPILEPVVAELRQRFSYGAYGLLDSTLLQIAVGHGAAFVQGMFARGDGGPVSYGLSVHPGRVEGAAGARTIALNKLNAEWNIPYRESVTNFETGQTSTQTMTRSLRIETNVKVPEGKLVVVGKAGSPTEAEAIFLVLRARVVE